MAYININGAYFDNSSGQMAAVNDPNILKGLKAGTIPATKQSSFGSAPASNTVATPTLLPQAVQQQIAQGNYNLSSTPTNTTTLGIGGGLNTGSTSPTNLVSFKDTLASVMDLAQQKRQKNMQAFMGTPGFQGTVAASDFNQLFSQMNAQGDVNSKYAAEDVVDKMSPDTSKNLQTVTETDDSGHVWAVTFDRMDPTKVTKVDLGQIGKSKSDTASDNKQQANDVASAILDFQNTIQNNGWLGANPDAYKYYKDQLVKLYGASAGLALDKAMSDLGITVDYENK